LDQKRPIRVAAISDQAIFLRGLTTLITSIKGVSLIGEGQNLSEALQLCQLTEPDLILLDLKDFHEHGREALDQIHDFCPSIKVVLLVSSPDENILQDEIDTKPHFYCLPKDISEQEFKSIFKQLQQSSSESRKSEQNKLTELLSQASKVTETKTDEALPSVQKNSPYPKQEIMARELSMAGKIQADILPEKVPHIPGWDICVTLEPARETSGDFYDFIPVTDQKWAVVVADVADKGMGAALVMALASTLIRTFASRFPTLPALVLNAVSERILSDTHGSMFVTAFFGILEPRAGRFIYANAGHPPAFLINTQRGKESIDYLRTTGMALGVSEQAQWRQKVIKLMPGDILVLYTDGITEAQNFQGEFFGEERLLDTILSKTGCTANEIQAAVLEEVKRFVGSAPSQDDIALITIRRIE
jgi:serine phosphatase RsbU (regulator of sigma subunit)